MRPEALQDMSVDTSLLLDRDYFFGNNNSNDYDAESMHIEGRNADYNGDNWEEERKRLEAEISMLKRKLVEQRLHFQRLLELPAEVERQLRRELGDKRFEEAYNTAKRK